MHAEVAVARADRGAETVLVGRVELVQLPAAHLSNRHRGHHLDAIDLVALDQSAEHARLDGTEVDGHEWMRHDREAALRVDRLDGVLDRHPTLDRPLQEPAEDVRLRGRSRGDLLPGDHDHAGLGAARLGLFDGLHRVVVGDGDEVELRAPRRFHQLRGRDHTVRRKRVAVRISSHSAS